MITLTTNRLTLKPLTTDFLHSTHTYASDPEHIRYMVEMPFHSLSETEAFLEKCTAQWNSEHPEFYEFAMLLDDIHIGAVSIYLFKHDTEGELGWLIHQDYQGKGYTTEAAREIMRFGFDDLGVKKIFAHCDSRNIGSAKIMEKLGLTLECADGVRRNYGAGRDSVDLKYSLSHGHRVD